MLLEIEHRLRFEYDAFIHQSRLELRVQPRNLAHQSLRSFVLAVGPPTTVWRYADWNGNWVHHFGIADYHDRIDVIVRNLVETHPAAPFLEEVTDPAPLATATGDALDFLGFGGPVLRSTALLALHERVPTSPDAPLGPQVRAVGTAIKENLDYRKDLTHYASTTDDVLQHGGGVCQDFAHVMLALLRLRRIPCRYVSGYLHVENLREGPSQSHAWVEVLSGQRGWVAFDPTHDRVPDERYVVVAYGRHYDDVPPNRGVYRGSARESLHAEVRTARSERKDVVGLHEEIARIELPVFRDLPSRARDAGRATPEQEGGAQQ